MQVGMQAGMRQGIFVLDGHAGGRVRGHSCFGWACRKAFRRASVFRMGKQEGMCFAVEHPEGLFVLDARVGRHVGRGCGRASWTACLKACLLWRACGGARSFGRDMWRGMRFREGHVEGNALSGGAHGGAYFFGRGMWWGMLFRDGHAVGHALSGGACGRACGGACF